MHTTYQVVQPAGEVEAHMLQNIAERAEWTVLYFYPRDNTAGCTAEAIEFTSLVHEFKKLDTQVIGVSKDSTSSHCNFLDKHELNIALISDPDLTLHKLYGARGEKNMYGKITEGTIRSTYIINKNLDLIHSWTNVRARGHAEKVLARVDTNLK